MIEKTIKKLVEIEIPICYVCDIFFFENSIDNLHTV